MKSFLQFLTETSASQQAARLGLEGDGHGGWYDRKTGEFTAKTENMEYDTTPNHLSPLSVFAPSSISYNIWATGTLSLILIFSQLPGDVLAVY